MIYTKIDAKFSKFVFCDFICVTSLDIYLLIGDNYLVVTKHKMYAFFKILRVDLKREVVQYYSCRHSPNHDSTS